MPGAANSTDSSSAERQTLSRHLLSTEDLSREQIDFYLDNAQEFVEVGRRSVKKVPTLRGKTIINLFLEPSTRTRTSFELAGKRMSADVINISGSSSSVTKGETLLDTAYTLESMNPDVVVIRHASSGAAHFLSKALGDTSIVNAGDGLHEHPTQSLLDALSIRQRLSTIDNLTIAYVGDALRSRVVRSNLHLFSKFGCTQRIVAPPTLALDYFKDLGAEVHYSLADGLKDADVVVSLRMKHEYLGAQYIPNLDEYSRNFIINEAALRKHCPDAIVLAPGPMVRGVEISSEVADGPRSLIRTQVNNGVAVRMAVLFFSARMAGSGQPEKIDANLPKNELLEPVSDSGGNAAL